MQIENEKKVKFYFVNKHSASKPAKADIVHVTLCAVEAKCKQGNAKTLKFENDSHLVLS